MHRHSTSNIIFNWSLLKSISKTEFTCPQDYWKRTVDYIMDSIHFVQIYMVGSALINSGNNPSWYKIFGLVSCFCEEFQWSIMGFLILPRYHWNPAGYLRVIADHVHPFVTTWCSSCFFHIISIHLHVTDLTLRCLSMKRICTAQVTSTILISEHGSNPWT